jgi:hypothetical protein
MSLRLSANRIVLDLRRVLIVLLRLAFVLLKTASVTLRFAQGLSLVTFQFSFNCYIPISISL